MAMIKVIGIETHFRVSTWAGKTAIAPKAAKKAYFENWAGKAGNHDSYMYIMLYEIIYIKSNL